MATASSAPWACGYPVEKTAACGTVKAIPHIFHAAEPPSRAQAANTVRYRFDKKGANEVGDECNQEVNVEHGRMVALSGLSVKAGKLGWDAGRFRQLFPPLQISRFNVG